MRIPARATLATGLGATLLGAAVPPRMSGSNIRIMDDGGTRVGEAPVQVPPSNFNPQSPQRHM